MVLYVTTRKSYACGLELTADYGKSYVYAHHGRTTDHTRALRCTPPPLLT